MGKINDTAVYPITSPALNDLVIGTDKSNTVNDAGGEVVNFTLQAIVNLLFRWNATDGKFEGWNGTAFQAIGLGATGGGADAVFVENDQEVTEDYTITSGKNAMSVGPVAVGTGVSVTVPAGSRWVVL